MTLRVPGTALEAASSSGRATEGPVTLVDLQRVSIRHQPRGPFRLEYDGRRPMVIFFFSPARPACGGPVLPRGAFSVLRQARPLSLESVEPTETLAVAFGPPRRRHRTAAAGGATLRGLDPGVRALAHEMRRVLLTEGHREATYLGRLADSLVIRALQVSGPEPAGRRGAELAPFALRLVQEHIDSRLADRITVDELARVAGLSRGHFSRAFHAATGDSPHQFILTRRLAEARKRLDAGGGGLAQIALQTGFSSHAHLTTAFGRAFGVSPQVYRRLRQAADPAAALAART